ncbi:diguanylate cyclase [Lysinibacillus sp. KU-BSD001]|uniref:GGDEF domain-containing protein n=1 Tax=Lysinibacillus sp. KU-BSD001 TaxID=3141328 RepID=UPI0036E848FF
MKLLDIRERLSNDKQKELEWQLFYENMMRSKLFAKVVIVFEVLLILMNVFSPDEIFNPYFFMYITLLLLALVMLVYISIFEKGDIHEESRFKKFQKGLHVLVFLFLLWGAVLTLVDQHSYGHIMAFVVNAMCVSILFHASNTVFFRLFTIPVIVLVGGLPFFQVSEEVLVGHYINLAVFLFFCWLAAKMLYTSYYRNFCNKVLLEESNEKLAQNMEENIHINLQLEQAVKQLKQLTTMDELSQIPNRRGFDEYIQKYIERIDTKQRLSIIMLDIDSFKLYNDYYGHVAGDSIIREVAQQIHAYIDPTISLAARYGGEEFIIATFNVPVSDVQRLGEKIRIAIERLQIPHKESSISNVVTISLGLAAGDITQEADIKVLIEKADQMLYKAKQTGRNRLEIWAEDQLRI